jgi:TetR/AcrR family acrAB operon transcriptional repressor
MEILNFKCEFVGEMEGDLAEYVGHNEECLAKLLRTYQAAQKAGELRAGISPKMAALETLVFLTGLLRLRLLGVPSLQTRRELNALINAHVDSRRSAG